MSSKGKTVAVVGSGITGLAASSHFDNNGCRVILLEKSDHFGGHCYTVDYKGTKCDLGFMVMNPVTYHDYIKWLSNYDGISLENTDMSFSSYMNTSFQWSSIHPITCIKNIFNIDLWKMLFDIIRFEKILFDEYNSILKKYNNIDSKNIKWNSINELNDILKRYNYETVNDFQNKYKLNNSFMNNFFCPQSGSIWSMPADEIRYLPAKFMINFMYKHELACLWERPQWKTIKNRSQTYVTKVIDKHFGKNNKHGNECYNGAKGDVKKLVFNVGDRKDQIKVITKDGEYIVDHVLFACHPRFAMEILNKSGYNKHPLTNYVLSKFKCSDNTVVLHCDDRVMPKNKRCWAAWNYFSSENNQVNVTYWLNLLQNYAKNIPNIFVTLNPLSSQKDILKHQNDTHIWKTTHPQYTIESWKLLELNILDRIQNINGLSFAGAWARNGFHNDGFYSGMKEAHRILDMEYIPSKIIINKKPSYYMSWIINVIYDIIYYIIYHLLCFFVYGRFITNKSQKMH